MEGSLVMVVSAVYLLGLLLAGIAAWRGWLGLRWQWLAGWLVSCLLIPLLPLEAPPTTEVEAVIAEDRAAAELRAAELPPRVEVDTGRDFEDALDRFGDAVQARAEENEATQQPEEK